MATLSFGSRPAEKGDAQKFYDIYRCRVGTPLRGVFISEAVEGCDTHWYGGTIPHVEPASDCLGCQKERSIRWEGYAWAWLHSTNKIFMCAIPAGPIGEFDNYILAHGNLRGCSFELSKPGMSQQSRVNAKLQRSQFPLNVLPQPPQDIRDFLKHLWKLDKSEVPIETRLLTPACRVVTEPKTKTKAEENQLLVDANILLMEARERNQEEPENINGAVDALMNGRAS